MSNSEPDGSSVSPNNQQIDQLTQFGLDDDSRERFNRILSSNDGLVPGRIGRVDGISNYVHCGDIDYRAVSTFARIAHDDEFEIEPVQPTVGDWVLVRPDLQTERHEIELVLPRKSLLKRKRAMRGDEEGDNQLLAANIDTVFIAQSASYLNGSRLERELAVVWDSGARPVVVLTKSDIVTQDEMDEALDELLTIALDVEVIPVSGITGTGTHALQPFLQPGQTVVLLGASGVGKSTLVNHMMGEEVMDTGEIRESDTRGRHTTTTRQLLSLPSGAALIDTPGIRSIGLSSGSEEALLKTFSEVEQYLGKCRFRDCGHSGEPGCAIGEAIEAGDLIAERFDSYKRMLREIEFEQTKNDPAVKTEQQIRMKKIARSHRQKSKFEKRQQRRD